MTKDNIKLLRAALKVKCTHEACNGTGLVTNGLDIMKYPKKTCPSCAGTGKALNVELEVDSLVHHSEYSEHLWRVNRKTGAGLSLRSTGNQLVQLEITPLDIELLTPVPSEEFLRGLLKDVEQEWGNVPEMGDQWELFLVPPMRFEGTYYDCLLQAVMYVLIGVKYNGKEFE